jgi:hypothetical protein
VDWTLLVPFAGLLIGCALRTLLPYIVAGLETCRDTESWQAWPRFKPSYLASFGIAVVGYGVMLAVIPGAWGWTLELGLVPSIACAYTGQSLARLGVKAAIPSER